MLAGRVGSLHDDGEGFGDGGLAALGERDGAGAAIGPVNNGANVEREALATLINAGDGDADIGLSWWASGVIILFDDIGLGVFLLLLFVGSWWIVVDTIDRSGGSVGRGDLVGLLRLIEAKGACATNDKKP